MRANSFKTDDAAQPEWVTVETAAVTPLGVLMPYTWYKAAYTGLPDILLMRRPSCLMTNPHSPNLRDHYKAVFVETPGDRKFVEACLAKPMPLRNGHAYMADGIGKTNLRRSELPVSADFRILYYDPPVAGWPYLVVMMHGDYTPGPFLSRGRYAMDAFADLEALQAFDCELKTQSKQSGLPLIDLTGAW